MNELMPYLMAKISILEILNGKEKQILNQILRTDILRSTDLMKLDEKRDEASTFFFDFRQLP
jgi:hypothetical protein